MTDKMPVIVAATPEHAKHTVEQYGWEVQQRGLRYRNNCGQIVNFIFEGQELGGFPKKTKVYLGYLWERRKDAIRIKQLIAMNIFVETGFEE